MKSTTPVQIDVNSRKHYYYYSLETFSAAFHSLIYVIRWTMLCRTLSYLTRDTRRYIFSVIIVEIIIIVVINIKVIIAAVAIIVVIITVGRTLQYSDLIYANRA